MQKKLQDNKFIIGLTVLAAILFMINFLDRDPAVRWVNSYNTTMLAFSYKYGLIPRALIGSLYQGLGTVMSAVFGIDMNTMGAVKVTVLTAVICFILLVLHFAARADRSCMSPVSPEGGGAARYRYLITFFVIVTVTTFAGYYNFGRVDMFLVAASLVMTLLIVDEKAVWLVCLICPACELIHEAYVFMYFNVVLVLLFYRIVRAYEEKDSNRLKKYTAILAVTLILTCGIFLYMLIFGNKAGGQEAYDAIYETARAMVYKGKPHKDLLQAELLGVNLGDKEWEYHIANFWQLGMFVILYSPFIAVLATIFIRMFKAFGQDGGRHVILTRLPYIAMAVGALTTLPLFILKIDYGRWIYAVIAYYCLMLMAFMMMRDEKVTGAYCSVTARLAQAGRFVPALLVVYSAVFVPFYDMSIDRIIQAIYDAFFG